MRATSGYGKYMHEGKKQFLPVRIRALPKIVVLRRCESSWAECGKDASATKEDFRCTSVWLGSGAGFLPTSKGWKVALLSWQMQDTFYHILPWSWWHHYHQGRSFMWHRGSQACIWLPKTRSSLVKPPRGPGSSEGDVAECLVWRLNKAPQEQRQIN